MMLRYTHMMMMVVPVVMTPMVMLMLMLMMMAHLDQTPVWPHKLWQLALVKICLCDERHHVDVDRLLGVFAVWEAVTSKVRIDVDRSKIKRLWPLLIDKS